MWEHHRLRSTLKAWNLQTTRHSNMLQKRLAEAVPLRNCLSLQSASYGSEKAAAATGDYQHQVKLLQATGYRDLQTQGPHLCQSPRVLSYKYSMLQHHAYLHELSHIRFQLFGGRLPGGSALCAAALRHNCVAWCQHRLSFCRLQATPQKPPTETSSRQTARINSKQKSPKHPPAMLHLVCSCTQHLPYRHLVASSVRKACPLASWTRHCAKHLLVCPPARALSKPSLNSQQAEADLSKPSLLS